MGIEKEYLRRAGQKGSVVLAASFDTGEQGVFRTYFPFPVRLTKIRTRVIKALAATDAGTVTGANSTGASAGGVTTHALSAAFGDEQTATPTTNNTVAADSYYQVTTAKTTVGGKIQVSLEYVRN